MGARILVLGEAPGRDEDASGRPFVGRAGRILDAALEAAGLDRASVFVTNVVKCRPPGNRRPRRDEVVACAPFLRAQIDALRPRLVVTLGATALRGLLGPGHELRAVRGRALEFRGIRVVATYHPAAVLYNRTLETVIRRDLRNAVRSSQRAPPTGRTRGRGPAAKRSRRPRP